jgi:hypothetical protein
MFCQHSAAEAFQEASRQDGNHILAGGKSQEASRQEATTGVHTLFNLSLLVARVGQNHTFIGIYVGLARTINIWCIYDIFGREVTNIRSYTAHINGSGQP